MNLACPECRTRHMVTPPTRELMCVCGTYEWSFTTMPNGQYDETGVRVNRVSFAGRVTVTIDLLEPTHECTHPDCPSGGEPDRYEWDARAEEYQRTTSREEARRTKDTREQFPRQTKQERDVARESREYMERYEQEQYTRFREVYERGSRYA